ncbi:Glucosamine-6-phosphate deaminase 1 [Arenibacter antarcticus]|uniref:6-phosphogluconolactonase n=1 Tax=Arenibacter antarcticus TaxID=2040469 RepID=A0ABW5VF82_9FLAO|nr:6-phosphogluconolactonase [Arenibacter sp. H213]MCM4166277.1 hypothetical protein [Arenibacter sp. H213]
MEIHYCSDYEKMTQMAFERLISELRDNPEQLLCPSKGTSTLGLYKKMAAHYQKEAAIFERLTIIKLDEWGGIPGCGPNSSETHLKTYLLDPLKITEERYISFDSSPVDAKKECDRMDNEIQERGPIDICILGMGKNGHLGFNEPANHLIPNCHIAELSPTSLMSSMAESMPDKPSYGLTMGMATILQSKKIILLLTGEDKKHTIKKLLNKEITSFLPASFLWLHPQVYCYLDKSSV